jgi:N-acetylglucosamine kinase-like BadF-type ATPase
MRDDFTHSYSIGVDGGGTKTLAIIVDADGNECGRGYAGSANHTHAGIKPAVEHIRTAVEKAAHQAACTLPLQAAWFGLAGIDRPADCDLLLPHLRPLAHHIRLTNDADLVLSGLPDMVGMALIAGTGSIALGRDARGVSARAGGWGHLIGDEGSGYDLGCRCLQAVAKAADGRGPATVLVELVLKQWKLNNTSDIIGKVYNDCDQATIAALSALVCSAARDNDEVASGLVEDAAHELALSLAALKKRLDFTDGSIPLALSGGLLLHEGSFREQVIRATSKHLSIGTITIVEEPALSGARALTP